MQKQIIKCSFQVHVKLPPYLDDTEEFISGSVSGLYTTQRYAEGNGTLTLFGRNWKANETFVRIWTEQVFFVSVWKIEQIQP